MSRKVVFGLVLFVALVAGVVAGLLLIAPSDEQQAAPPSTAVPAPATTSTRAVERAADGAAQAIADAITEGDSLKFGLITCDPQSSAELRKLQDKWDAAGAVSASIARPPLVTGDRATVTIHVEGAGGEKETEFPLRKKGEKWCVPG
ncbi:hypothetical protein [Amycolatopsis sp.]|jgi:hypothetical protein|uniref:hypothetical protein n=1 Tax=Amycolatopsis sp. TaxID=37632 RepID=UPI002E0C1108|nr:hypothetical protein [Amycolatopsis sp.]